MEDRQQLIGYDEVLKLTGVCKGTLLDRIDRAGVTVYIDGRDRRRRLIDRADVERLTRIELVERIEPTGREYDGSAA